MLTLLTFRIKNTLFGIEINRVREINRNVEYTNVPGAPKRVVGLFNMRGRIVVLYNFSYLFNYPNCAVEQGSTCIVLKSTGENQDINGFFIDQTGDVLNIEEESMELPPANASGQEFSYIKSVVKLEKNLLLLLDPEKIFNMNCKI